ncbi:MAG: hypothetical protein ABW278_10055, partial [Steroidobacteraceae bacterium]
VLAGCGGGDASEGGQAVVPVPTPAVPVPAVPAPAPTPTPAPAPAPVVPPAVTMTNPAPGSGKFAGANFWNIDWQGQPEYFRAGVNFATTADPWRTDLVADLAPYKVLRFMDWNDINAASTPQAHFSTRKAKTAAQGKPVAYEWQIDLCNRADKDCWITVHSQSNAEDWRQLAQMIKASLKPALRVYIEWSNEVWNPDFPQHAYAEAEARRLMLPGSNPAAAYSVYASVRLFDEFGKVFAGESRRLVRVLAGQSQWTGPCDAQLEALSNAQTNPSRIWPDAYAIAPYLKGTSIQTLRAAIPGASAGVANHRACPQRMGVPLIAYEGGSDSFVLGSGCANLQRDAGMRDLYREYLTAMTAAGLNGPFMQYTHTGECWGVKVHTGDAAANSPKFQGLMDWLSS